MANEVIPFDQYLLTELGNIEEALPVGFNKTRFTQNCVALLYENKELQKFPRNQLKIGLFKGAYLGLDFFNKECYLIPYSGELQFMPDYKGKIKLCKKYSFREIKDIFAKVVREGDVFEESIVNGEQSITFKPLPFNNSKVVGAFAMCMYKDGGSQIETMSLAELEKVRSSSKARNSPAWSRYTTEMYKKCVLSRLCKHIPLDFENSEQIRCFNEDLEIETDPREMMKADVQENANSEEFIIDAEEVIANE